MRKSEKTKLERLFLAGRPLFCRLFTSCCFILAGLHLAGQPGGRAFSIDYREVKLLDALNDLNRQSENRVMFKVDEISVVQAPVTASATSVTLLEAVKACLPAGRLTAVERNGIVIVSPVAGQQQPVKPVLVKGVVVDARGMPLPGVTVLVKETTTGVATDGNGKFALSVALDPSTIVLQFTFIGMKKQEVAYTAGAELRVVMEEENVEVGEVVVTGIFTKARESYTGAATTVTAQELRRVGNRSLLSSLQSIDPAFNIVENIEFGSDPNRMPDITIRGSSSLDVTMNDLKSDSRNNANLPLFILDGFEITLERMNDLDQSIVESVTLLKDASATAMYGTRGANGVVVITTREPDPGKLRLTYKGGVNVEAPDLRSYNLMNAREKLAYEKAAGLYEFSRADNEQDLIELYNARLKAVERGVDTYWLGYPVRTGVGSRHSVRVEGGAAEFLYAANIGYDNVEGAMKGSSRNTFNGDVYLSYNYKNVTFKNDLIVSFNKSKNSPYGTFSEFSKINSYWKPYDDEGNLVLLLEDNRYYASLSGYLSATYFSIENPMWNSSLPSKDESRYTQIQDNFEIMWGIIPKDLIFRGRFGYTKSIRRSDVYISSQHTKFKDYAGSDFGRKGEYTYSTGEGVSYEASFALNYNKAFNGVHQVYAGVNYSIAESKDEDYSISAEGISNIHMDFLGMATLYEQGGRPSGSEGISRRVGGMFNVNYTYDHRYFLDISGNMEGSSKFGSSNRTAPFGSVGVGWNMHHESFLSRREAINEARLRFSYGTSGSQNFDPYQAMTSFKDYGNFSYNNWYGMDLLGMGNKELGWQTTYTTNLGVDLSLFNRRVSLTADFYHKRTEDMLSDITLPSSAGFDTYKANVGELSNTGVEVSLRGYLIRDYESGWRWFIGGTLVHNKSKITKISNSLEFLNQTMLAEDQANPSFLFKEGQSINTIFAVKSLGIDPSNGQEIFQKLDGTLTYTWDARDKIACGIAEPKFFGNFNTTLSYKNLSFTAVFSYRYGGFYYNQTLANKVENIFPYHNADKRAYYDRWKTPGEVALYKGVRNFSATNASTRFVMKENTLHCSSMSVQYEWQADWLKEHLSISYLSVNGYLEDVFRLSTIKQERGLSYPFSRKISMALTARF
jgi:TonB-linked SusC/RagA family outer membrane protein